jgi:predicted transposase/invertase (TIGR01784 family)
MYRPNTLTYSRAFWGGPWLKLFTCKERSQYDELAQQHPEVGMAIALLKEMSLFGQIRMLADDLEIQRRDKAAIMEYALNEATEKGLKNGMEKGLARGLEKGLEQGLEQGRAETRQKQLEIARKLKLRGIPDVQIAEDTGLSLKEIEKL